MEADVTVQYPTRHLGRVLVVVLAVVAAVLLTLPMARPAQASAPVAGDTKTKCVYPSNSRSMLAAFSSAVGTDISCVLLFNNAKPSWSAWTTAWWLHPPSSDTNWMQWMNEVPGRQIVISQPMVPDNAPADWRVQGAAGAYDGYASQLATNLVAAGLGSAIIRLGWEANGTSMPESNLGTDPSQYGDWARYWGRIVTAMRAVPGAHFLFDWTINQYWRPIPLNQWYPGDNVVDIIGIDAYDSGIYTSGLTPQQRWQKLVNEPDGLAALAAFAQSHGKPMSIPEWSLEQSGSSGGGDDDPTYVTGLANFVATHDVAYNSYFLKPVGDPCLPLPSQPQSLAAYQQGFVSHRSTAPLAASGPARLLSTTSAGVVGSVDSNGVVNAARPLGTLNDPIVGIASMPSGSGYWLVASDGGIFALGGAGFYGSTGALHLNRPIVGMAATPDGNGYWLVASDGGIFSFGDAAFHGSTGALHLNRPIVGMAATPDGNGYWLVASDGGIFSFGDGSFLGSPAGSATSPVVGMVTAGRGLGYWLLHADATINAYGSAWSVASLAPGATAVTG